MVSIGTCVPDGVGQDGITGFRFAVYLSIFSVVPLFAGILLLYPAWVVSFFFLLCLGSVGRLVFFFFF